jgi:hypothetical protein
MVFHNPPLNLFWKINLGQTVGIHNNSKNLKWLIMAVIPNSIQYGTSVHIISWVINKGGGIVGGGGALDWGLTECKNCVLRAIMKARTEHRYKDITNIEMDLEEFGSMILLYVLPLNITLLIACIRNATWLGPSHWPVSGLKIHI